ncbi:Transposase [Umezakia ovalisporum]|jgi:hypothetical protein|nr:Transposase [Umezakia ovalisporum]
MSAGFETKSSDSNKRNRRQSKPVQLASTEAIQQSLVENFGDIKDPRVERTKKYQLTDVLVIVILAVIARAQGWEDMENYGISKEQWLEEFLELPNGIPSDDTFTRVFEFITIDAMGTQTEIAKKIIAKDDTPLMRQRAAVLADTINCE